LSSSHTTTHYGNLAIMDYRLCKITVCTVEDDLLAILDSGEKHPKNKGDLGWDLEDKLTCLTPMQRQVVIGRLSDGLTCTQIGESLGVSYQMVIGIWDQAILALRAEHGQA